MRCRDCPYGIESFEKYKSYIYEEDAENCVWCDKVGGKVYSFGHCSDWYEQDEEDHKNHSKKKRMNKRERYLKHQNHLKYLETVSCGNPKAVIYKDEIWDKKLGYAKNPKPYYKRQYRYKISKYLKRQSNQKIRRYKGELHNGNQCHKLYDFWWRLT
jgi:hypothetical protein